MGRQKKLHQWTQEQQLLEQEAKEKAEWAALDEAAAAAAEARKPERYEDWLAAPQKNAAALQEQKRLERAAKPKPLGAGNATKPAAKKPRAAPTV